MTTHGPDDPARPRPVPARAKGTRQPLMTREAGRGRTSEVLTEWDGSPQTLTVCRLADALIAGWTFGSTSGCTSRPMRGGSVGA